MTGLVTFMNEERGFGFIKPLIGKPDSKETIYFHMAQFRRDTDGRRPAPPPVGAELRFDVCRGEKGPQATNIELVTLRLKRGEAKGGVTVPGG